MKEYEKMVIDIRLDALKIVAELQKDEVEHIDFEQLNETVVAAPLREAFE